MNKLARSLVGGLMSLASALALATTDLVVATVNNEHMLAMQQLTPFFEAEHPEIRVHWVVMEEGVLRQRVSTDIATSAGQFDVMTIGLYEAPIWGQRRWLLPIQADAAYDLPDLLPTIREGLSVNGQLLAAPFYGESSMLMFRTDLLEKAGKRLPAQPTWDEVRELAAALHNPDNGVYGICLRGKPGWGDNMALLGTMVNTFGGQWFDMNWQPQIDSAPWHRAISFYVDLMQKYGPPDATANSYNETLALFAAGHCGMWVDATVAASYVLDPAKSAVAGRVGLAPAPVAVTPKGSSWLWAWALAVPTSSRNPDAAATFVRWATSREYIELVGKQLGWNRVPPGTRMSTYQHPEVRKALPYLSRELAAIQQADPDNSTLEPSPYKGVQLVLIPEFQSIGLATGRQISAALAGKRSVADALKAAQVFAEREMRKSRASQGAPDQSKQP